MGNAPELKEEVASRHETGAWDLRVCPCCKAKARIEEHGDFMRIMCSQWLCRVVEGKTMENAVAMWNEKSFRDK